jgi:transposase
MFVGETLAKRIVSLVLITADIPNARITETTGLSDRSLWMLKKLIHNGDTDALFIVGHGGGRIGKAKGFEAAIAEELEKNNYHTRQQIADMILEKFGIRMSVSAVGKLLKKRHQAIEEWLNTRKSKCLGSAGVLRHYTAALNVKGEGEQIDVAVYGWIPLCYGL